MLPHAGLEPTTEPQLAAKSQPPSSHSLSTGIEAGASHTLSPLSLNLTPSPLFTLRQVSLSLNCSSRPRT